MVTGQAISDGSSRTHIMHIVKLYFDFMLFKLYPSNYYFTEHARVSETITYLQCLKRISIFVPKQFLLSFSIRRREPVHAIGSSYLNTSCFFCFCFITPGCKKDLNFFIHGGIEKKEFCKKKKDIKRVHN